MTELGTVDSGYDCPDCGGFVMVKVLAREPRNRGLEVVGDKIRAVVEVIPERVFCDTCGREFE